MEIRRVIAAPDKFKGTATAAEVAQAIGHACWDLGIDCVEIPMADGGDGLLEVLGGANRVSSVTGPLGDPVDAPWRLHRETAVIEMATASGLAVVGGSAGNDAVAASTTGTGELIEHALDAGADRIIVGLGGSATTDGGFGAVRAISGLARLRGVELLVACDVDTLFTDAAEVFGPQKGATPVQIRLLNGRLERLTQLYAEEFGVDVRDVPGSGAAGGLGGALAALGGRLLPGVELVADELDLFDDLASADLVITGEGRLDETSFHGKVVGGVAELASDDHVPVAAIVGGADPETLARHPELLVVVLEEIFGAADASDLTARCVEGATAQLLTLLAAADD